MDQNYVFKKTWDRIYRSRSYHGNDCLQFDADGQFDPHRLIASDPVQEKLEKLRKKYGISIAKDNLEAVNTADFVFINVLPNIVGRW